MNGGDGRLEKHHPDYSKPFEIIVLCVKCHNILHRRNREINFGGKLKLITQMN